MTQPVSHGYPDWGRYAAVADKVLVADTQSNISVTTTYPRLFVGDVPYLGINLTVTANHMAFRFLFWDAPTGGNSLTGQGFSIRNGSDLEITIPVGGPWVELIAIPSAANSAFSRLLFTSSQSHRFTFLGYGEGILISFNQSIPAGNTVTFSANKVFPGEAHWFTESPGDNWTSRVETFDFAGTATIIDEFRTTTIRDAGRQIFLPPIDVRMVVVNSGAVGASFRGALVARPIEPGR